MDRMMRSVVREFKGTLRSNPPEDLKQNFRNYLISRGITVPSEQDLMDAAEAVGIPEYQIAEFVEEFGSRL